jgi:hypothetical protein
MAWYIGKRFKYDRCDVTVTHISAKRDTRYNMNTKKLIGTSMIALLVVALSVSMAAADTGWIRAVDGSGTDMTITPFGPGDIVYGNGNGLDGISADIYVVPNRVWVHGDNMSTIAYTCIVTGVAANEVDAAAVPPTQKDLGTVGLGSGEIPYPGEYDILYDCNHDGIYDIGDTVNHFDVCKAFTTIPEFTTLAIPMIALLGLVLYMRRKKD